MDLEGKNYMLMLDNGDGTCTSIVAIADADIELTTLIEMEFAELVEASVGVALSSPEFVEEFIEKATEIPNSTEGLEE